MPIQPSSRKTQSALRPRTSSMPGRSVAKRTKVARQSSKEEIILSNNLPEPKAQTISFLELPAEIRLLIYEQAALLDQRLIKLDRRAAENQDSSYRGDTFNFLQTSAQVRSEFGPIYHRNARFALSKQDVVRFWTGLIKNGLPLAAVTILIVSTNPLPGFSHSQITRGGRFSANDFFPILEMYLRTSTACELRIAEYNEERQVAVPRQPVQLALDILTKGNDRWKSDIRNRRVSQVLVQSSGSFCQIRIIYKSPHEQPWMRNMLSFDAEVQQWASALGFIAEGESKLPDCVRLSFGVFY